MNNEKKQSRREKKDTYVGKPQKSADPPQPQGKKEDSCRQKAN